MVRLGIQLKCAMENIAELKPAEGFLWRFKVKCTSCNEEHGSVVSISEEGQEEMHGSRGTAHLVMKCSFCKRDMTINIESATKKNYTQDDDGAFKTMVTIECRGIDVLQWVLEDGFIATSSASKETFDVDLSDDFVEYDETGAVPVGISETETKIVRVK